MAEDVFNHVRVAAQHKLRGIQQVVAQRLVAAQREAASVTAMAEATADALLAAQANRRTTAPNVTLTHQFIKALAMCLERHPRLNSALHEGVLYEFAQINIALAVSSDSGDLQVVVVRDANVKTIEAIANELDGLLERARRGKLTLDDTRGATFTLSNYGQLRHTTWATPILSPGQAGVLGIGRIRPQPVVDVNGALAVRQVLPLSLTYDHRIVNGVPAGLFLDDLADIIETGMAEA